MRKMSSTRRQLPPEWSKKRTGVFCYLKIKAVYGRALFRSRSGGQRDEKETDQEHFNDVSSAEVTENFEQIVSLLFPAFRF